MKGSHSSIVILTAMAIVLSACGKLSESCDPGAFQTVNFIAENADTRTMFDTPDGTTYPVIWTEKDTAVSISLNYGAPVTAKVTPSSDGKTAKFSASFPVASDDVNFIALSPASAYAGMANKSVRVLFSIPEEQYPSASSVDPAAQVMVSPSSQYTIMPSHVYMYFKHITAYMKISLTGLDLKGARVFSVSITADTELAGKAAFEVSTKKVFIVDGSRTVTAKTSSLTDVWFGTFPVDLSGRAVVVSVKTGEGTFTRKVSMPKFAELTSGKVASFRVDMSSAEHKKPDRESISVLAVGNSFSQDALNYLYDLLKAKGYSEIILGNIYKGGCSLETHADYFANSTPGYSFKTNTTGKWKSKASSEAIASMKSHEWDFVTVQQYSGYSGRPETYEPFLSAVLDSVKANCPGAVVLWHMTWAYHQCSSSLKRFGYSQTAMYDAIVSAVKDKVLPHEDISGVIPSGTAIQNARSSFIGDNFSRDGSHLSHGTGRLTAALTYLKAITGCSIQDISWTPSSYPVSERELAAIKEAVDAACDNPFGITQATDVDRAFGYTENTALRQALSDAGYDLTEYNELPYGIVGYSYYDSSDSAILRSRQSNGDAAIYAQSAAVPYYFTKSDLPVGTLLVIDDGWMVRPEGWIELREKATDRPDNITAKITVVDSAWWGSFKYRSFNIARVGSPDLSTGEMDSIRSRFAIFVPNE